MDVIEALQKLEGKGGTISLVDGMIKIRAPQGLLLPSLVKAVRSQKSTIVRYLLSLDGFHTCQVSATSFSGLLIEVRRFSIQERSSVERDHFYESAKKRAHVLISQEGADALTCLERFENAFHGRTRSESESFLRPGVSALEVLSRLPQGKVRADQYEKTARIIREEKGLQPFC